MNKNERYLFVTSCKTGKMPVWVKNIFKGLGINQNQVDEPKIIDQTKLTNTNIFVDTVKEYTGTTTCIIRSQVKKTTLNDSVKTGKSILVFNSEKQRYTRYANGNQIKTWETRKTTTVSCATV